MDDTDWMRNIGKLNRDAIEQRNRADYWQRVALYLWLFSTVQTGLIWWKW